MLLNQGYFSSVQVRSCTKSVLDPTTFCGIPLVLMNNRGLISKLNMFHVPFLCFYFTKNCFTVSSKTINSDQPRFLFLHLLFVLFMYIVFLTFYHFWLSVFPLIFGTSYLLRLEKSLKFPPIFLLSPCCACDFKFCNAVSSSMEVERALRYGLAICIISNI